MILGDGVVRLRPLEERDVAPYLGAFAEDAGLANLLGLDEPPSRDELLGYEWRGAGAVERYEWAIADAGSDAFLGALMLHSCDWRHRRAETRFWVTPAARGRGVVSRALALVLEWCWANGLERMELTALPENTVVPRVAEKFGYVFEGTMRGRNFERGRRVDILTWGLLRPTST